MNENITIGTTIPTFTIDSISNTVYDSINISSCCTDFSKEIKKYNNINTKYLQTFKNFKKENYPNSYSPNTTFLYIEEYVPNKVYGFIFKDDTKIKTICQDEDTFDLEYAFRLALAKYRNHTTNKFTFEGILKETDRIRESKADMKNIEIGMKLFKYIQKCKEEEKQKAIQQKEQHKKYVAKKIARKERLKAKQG